MFLLITGLVIWSAAHFLRSLAPGLRDSMQQRFGNSAKGIVAVVVLLSLAMMIIGFRSAEHVLLWTPPVWALYINNLLMILALYIYFTTATTPGTAFVFGAVKNPQLIGFKIWALGHLLVNGDLASVILFGGLLLWAVFQIVVSNEESSLVDRSLAPINSPWIHLLLVAGALMLISALHVWFGKWPFAWV